MNIETIDALVQQLNRLGFTDLEYSLLQRICLKPKDFFLFYKIEKGKDQMSFQLYFRGDNGLNNYSLEYYDAIFQKELVINGAVIDGIDIADVEKRMKEIDWKSIFDFSIIKPWSLDDKSTWINEAKAEAVIADLVKLESSEEGKLIAIALKLRYWTGYACQDLVSNLIAVRYKTELFQRFYFLEGEPGIPADDAYRFLQNRWFEKKMLEKPKQGQKDKSGTANPDGPGSSSNSRRSKLNKRKILKSK